MGAPIDNTPVYETRYRKSRDENIAICIIEAVAEAADISEFDIDDQLYHAVDPEALEQVFRRGGLGPNGYVSFAFAGFYVVLRSSGDVALYER